MTSEENQSSPAVRCKTVFYAYIYSYPHQRGLTGIKYTEGNGCDKLRA